MTAIRVAEVLAALSMTTDLATGAPLETGMAVCVLGSALADELDLAEPDRAVVFHATLLSAVGCTAYASENAHYFDDDAAFQSALRDLDPGDPGKFAAQLRAFGSWAPGRAQLLAQRFVEIAPSEGPTAMRASCEVSAALGPRLGLPAAAVAALADVHERWDGLGMPGTHRGAEVPLAARILHVVEQAVRAHARGGRAAVVTELTARRGGHLDPELIDAFLRNTDALLARLDVIDRLAGVLAAEPGSPLLVDPGALDGLCHALSIVVDLKGRYLLGHSAHVAQLADSAGALMGLAPGDRATTRRAGLLHDLGRAAVPASIWDRDGPLSAGDWEQVRLHAYWTDRILRRCPALAGIAPVAAGHHERCDGSGYHRGVRGEDLPPLVRLLGCADVYAALTEERPHRPARPAADAARALMREAEAGRLDRAACAATLEATGLPRPRAARTDLTGREIEVLRLAARGLSNREIAATLVVSERTVGHHLAHVYDKTGRRTRAGAAVFAIEHGLLPG
ncbi:MAG TPA: HD domain-containing phosphohydrolase [Jatrophihabitans sp.]|nr:HD domain-containing phosphohydrolase [Jatrophihabitans sp.]